MNGDTLRLEAEGLLQRGDLAAALQRLEDLVRQAPRDPRNWRGLARALLEAGRAPVAVTALEQACQVAADDVQSRSLLGGVCQALARVDEAVHWHGQALALAPHSLVLRLNHAFIWPLVPSSGDQILSFRQRCLEAFSALQADEKVRLHPDHEATNHTGPMAYHGFNDRALLQSYARLVMAHTSRGLPPAPAQPGTGPAGRRHRIGFLSAFFHRHSNSRAFDGLLRALDRRRFSPLLIHLPGSRFDDVRQRLESMVDQVVHLPADVPLAWQQLAALRLDLLFVTDVGMSPLLPALLARRVAPVQCTGWGFPVTSGFPTLDYYLSGDLVEPPDGQDHYSEILVRLAGLPCRYLSEDLPVDATAAAMGRSYFLLPEDIPLVGCLQSIWKLHPDLDAVLERIALAQKQVLFVLVAPDHRDLSDALLARLRRSAPHAAERILLLNRMTRAEFGALAGCLDVLLDTPHFGSGISFFQTIASGTPLVTLEGPLLRSRMAAGGYRQMELDDPPVARDPQQMARLVIDLLADPSRRASLRTRIREAAVRHLYDRTDMVRSFEQFADQAITRAWQEPSRT